MACCLVHLVAVGIGITEDVTRNLNSHYLHTETDTKCEQVVLAAVLCSNYLPLETAWADTWTDDITVHTLEHLLNILLCDLLTVDEVRLDLAIVVCTAL